MDKTKWETDKKQKICFFDLDGVMNYYPQTWIDFVNSKGGTTFNDLYDMKFAIPYQRYKDLKVLYRTSGVKESFNLREGTVEVFTELKKQGYTIVIITSRPVHQHPQLISQTIRWLDKLIPEYDEVVFEDKKFITVLSKYPFLKFGVEDNRYYANLIAQWGYKMYLLNNKYNQGELHPNVIRITDLKEILNDKRTEQTI